MSRLFDGVNDESIYTVPASGVDVSGAHTLLCVCRILTVSDTAWQSIIETQTSAAAGAATIGRNNGGLIYWSQGATLNSGTSWTDSDNWVIVATTRAAGTVTTRMHKSVVGGANTHADAANGGTLAASPSIASGTIRIGGNDDFANIRVAAAALFNKVLSDAELNGINTALTTQSIYDLTPVWLVDDADGLVADYMNNADRTSVVGTADDADDPAGWVYGIAGGGTDAEVVSPVLDAVGDIPTPSASGDSNATVTSPPMDALGSIPTSGMIISVEVITGPLGSLGNFPDPAVSGTSAGDVTAPAAIGTGDLPVPALSAGSAPTTPVLDAVADVPAPAVVASSSPTSPPLDATGDLPTPVIGEPVERLRYGTVTTTAVEASARLTGVNEPAHFTGVNEPAHQTGADNVLVSTGALEVAI